MSDTLFEIREFEKCRMKRKWKVEKKQKTNEGKVEIKKRKKDN